MTLAAPLGGVTLSCGPASRTGTITGSTYELPANWNTEQDPTVTASVFNPPSEFRKLVDVYFSNVPEPDSVSRFRVRPSAETESVYWLRITLPMLSVPPLA